MHLFKVAVLLFTVSVLPTILTAQIKIDLQASRFSGVAPLTVFFDASNTTHAFSSINTFHDISYQWNFGDIHSGYWHHKPTSKNTATGPFTTHVFDSTGIHVVELEVRDNEGNSALKTIIIRVEAPSVTYSDTQTICFSTTSEFFDAPYGAKKVQISSLADVEPYVDSTRRLLFRRGDTIRSTIGLYIEETNNLTIGAYGPCLNMDDRGICANAPVILINDIGENAFNISNCNISRIATNIRIMDLNIINATKELIGNGIYCGGYTQQNLFYRLQIMGFSNGILFDHQPLGTWDSLKVFSAPLFDEITIANCIIQNGKSYGDGIKMSASRFALLGSDIIGDSTVTGNLINNIWVKKGVYLHNRLLHPSINRWCMLFGNLTIDSLHQTSEVIIKDNHFKGKLGNKQLVGMTYGIKNGLFNRNYLSVDTLSIIREGIVLKGSYISVKNNIINISNNRSKKFVGIVVKEESTVDISNNTIFKSDTIQFIIGIKVSNQVNRAIILNNLIYTPKAADLLLIKGRGIQIIKGRNIYPPILPFISQNPQQPLDFQLDTSSLILDRGFKRSILSKDYLGNIRTTKNTVDIGAFQFTVNPIIELTTLSLRASPLRNFPKRSRSYFAMDLSAITSDYDIEIFDTFGEIIYTDFKLRDLFFIWETANYEAGIYWISVSAKDVSLMQKIWIDR